MTVLSDNEISNQFDTLIKNGDRSRIGPSSYSVVPGKLFPTGTEPNGDGKPAVDWTVPASPHARHVVRAGELIVLRSRETITMPENCCGLWLQVEPISRKGLLLVNMSLIPPGYSGALTCTFANFGKSGIALTPNEWVAKIVFLTLASRARRQGRPWVVDRYDADLTKLAYASTDTFLNISGHAADLEKAIEEGKERLTEAAKKAAEDLSTDFWKKFLVAFPIVAIAMVLLGGAHYISATLSASSIDKAAKERADRIEAEVMKQLGAVQNRPTFVYSGSAEAKALLERINELERAVQKQQPVHDPSISTSATPQPGQP